MANAIYPEYKEFLLTAAANVSLNNDDTTNGPYVALTDTGDVAYSSAHSFYSSVVAASVGTDQRLSTPTCSNGTFDADNVTFSAVTGDPVEALTIYRKNSGANSTWKLVAYIDTSVTGLPVTPNGGDITITWNASGIFLISDERVKENIVPVGEYGALTIYEYDYVGVESKYLGFLAQEVEQIAPHAVGRYGDYKTVNYELAAAAALRA
jgi:activator of HSP90 ATPase